MKMGESIFVLVGTPYFPRILTDMLVPHDFSLARERLVLKVQLLSNSALDFDKLKYSTSLLNALW